MLSISSSASRNMWSSQQWRHQAWARGISSHPPREPPKCRLAPTVKHTGQESGDELREIFKLWSFLQSKSVNNVCAALPVILCICKLIWYQLWFQHITTATPLFCADRVKHKLTLLPLSNNKTFRFLGRHIHTKAR